MWPGIGRSTVWYSEVAGTAGGGGRELDGDAVFAFIIFIVCLCPYCRLPRRFVVIIIVFIWFSVSCLCCSSYHVGSLCSHVAFPVFFLLS